MEVRSKSFLRGQLMLTSSRALVVSTYQPPQVPSVDALTSVVASFQSDYRRLYIEHPRVRLDGVYIAVCHYMYVHRPSIPGLSPLRTNRVDFATVEMV